MGSPEVPHKKGKSSMQLNISQALSSDCSSSVDIRAAGAFPALEKGFHYAVLQSLLATAGIRRPFWSLPVHNINVMSSSIPSVKDKGQGAKGVRVAIIFFYKTGTKGP